jgi:hypothetical protein
MATEHAPRRDFAKQWGELVARAWSDEAFRSRLLAEPAPTLAEQGIQFSPGVEVRVHQSTPTLVHLVLPLRPAEELSDELLDAVAGGDTPASRATTSTLQSCFQTIAPLPSGVGLGNGGGTVG